MSNCNDKIEYTCGKKVNARCSDYEGDLSSCSDLNPDCNSHSVHDVLNDINSQLSTVCSQLDMTAVDNGCITYEGEGTPTLPEILSKLSSLICTIQDQLPAEGECNSVYSDPIDCAGLDYSCLVDECGAEANPQNLTELLQIMITQICANASA